ncbi:MAG TPA: DnaJ domain-containing protein [Methylophilaceae bacterium]|nr:DnaJ domain-containing protein [Methylophilaceae bacterium]
MKKIITHYDNLRVAPNASAEEIRASYKALCQKYHPDKNPDDAQAAKKFIIINAAYEVLSDPLKRRDHDDWIALHEVHRFKPYRAAQPAPKPNAKPRPEANFEPKGPQHGAMPPIPPAEAPQNSKRRTAIKLMAATALALCFMGMLAWGLLEQLEADRSIKGLSYEPIPLSTTSKHVALAPHPGIEPHMLEAEPAKSDAATGSGQYARAETAPNGMAWPAQAGYLAGFPRLNMEGGSRVTVDNSRNNYDVHVKLVYLETVPYPVRHLFIPAAGKFTIRKLNPGTYDLRFRDLTSGKLVRSEPFVLQELNQEQGIEYSNLTIALQEPAKGSKRAFSLTESDF